MSIWEDIKYFFCTQVDNWARRVRVLVKFSVQHPQKDYFELGMSLQLNWKYLERTVPRVGALMETIERYDNILRRCLHVRLT